MDIVSCNICKGEGTRWIVPLVGEGYRKYCTACNATGKVMTKSYTLSMPFTPESKRSKFYSLDEEILRLVRLGKDEPE